MTVADMKVGDRLILGAYTIRSSQNEASSEIVWLKATKSGVFLSEYVIDMVQFDEREPGNPNTYHSRYGNNDYESSNIKQYLNSRDDHWFQPMHEFDMPPGDQNVFRYGQYTSNPGFLSGFEEYEIDVLSGDVELPSVEEIYDGYSSKFDLFKRRGIRPRMSPMLCNSWRNPGYGNTSFIPYWTCSQDRDIYVRYISTDCRSQSATATMVHGLRPKCTIRSDAQVEQVEGSKNTYKLVPFTPDGSSKSSVIFTDEELSQFLGLL